MGNPRQRRQRKLALVEKIKELNGTAAGSVAVMAAVDTVEVVEDVVEDVVDVVEDIVDVVEDAVEDVVESVADAVETVVENVVEVVKPVVTEKPGRTRRAKTSRTKKNEE